MSLKKGKTSIISQKSARPTSSSMDYKVFAINFYGNALKPIKEEFIAQVKDGLRRNVFVIDMEEEIHLYNANQPVFDGKKDTTKESMERFTGTYKDMAQIALYAIKERRKQYDEITATLVKEKAFDLLEHWNKLPPVAKYEPDPSEKGKDKGKGKDKDKDNAKDKAKDDKSAKTAKNEKKAGKTSKVIENEEEGEEEYEYCPDDGPPVEDFILEAVVDEHNVLGNAAPISQRRYIEDVPAPEILYIVIVGEYNRDFYVELLRSAEPLLAVINFLPEESNYDHLLQRKDNIKFIKDTLQAINNLICDFRKPNETKPTGFFTTHLPVLSPCLARKLAAQIYAELSWYLYDSQLLLKQYHTYYVREFNYIDVEIPKHISLDVLREKVKLLEAEGHYFTIPPLVLRNDLASVALYLDKLLSSVQKPNHILNSEEIDLLKDYLLDPASVDLTEKSVEAMTHYLDGLEGITEVFRYQRLYVDGCNRVLISLIENVRKLTFQAVFRCCLDYNLLRTVYFHPKFLCKYKFTPYNENMDPLDLPSIAKFYPNQGATMQRIKQLLEEYDDYEILEILPKHRLYVFRRSYNEIFEHEKQIILPTRLCFRDFSIYQMKEFYRVLVLPDPRRITKNEAEEGDEAIEKLSLIDNTNDEIFIRQNSIKASYMDENVLDVFGECALKEEQQEDEGEHNNESENDDPNLAKSRGRNYDPSSETSYVGIPPKHRMLTGYSLDDVRQKICTKDSKYYFDEGHIKLSEDNWNFVLLNRSFEFKINHNFIYLSALKTNLNGISNTFRIATCSGININIANQEDQCTRILVSYPSGLNIFYYDTFTEQRWVRDDAPCNEKIRYFTPYGAVIVFYNDGMEILVMRYNGEVYHLIQYDEDQEEEGMGESDICAKMPSLDRLGAGKSKPSLGGTSESITSDLPNLTENEESLYDELREVIYFELKFIENLAKIYKLSWIRLRLITSIGRVYVVPRTGLISEEVPYELIEWNDYFCNESLALRGDDVRMVWTHDCLRCYHCDGTTFRTKTVECLVDLFGLETDSMISQSSSHLKEEQAEEEVKKETTRKSTVKAIYHFEGDEGPVEVEEREDTRYVNIVNSEYLELQTCYASVFFAYCGCFNIIDSPFMEVCGPDQIRYHIDTFYEEFEFLGEEEEGPQYRPEFPCKRSKHITLWIGESMQVLATEDDFQICTALEKCMDMESRKCKDCVSFKIDFKDSLTNIFHYLVTTISGFKKCPANSKLLYFLDKRARPYQCQGFEFMERMPPLCEYSLRAGNTTVELSPLVSINHRFRCSDLQRICDLLKFPRFPDFCREDEEPKPEGRKDSFPYILEAR